MGRRWSAQDLAALKEIAGRVGGRRAAAKEWNRTHPEQLSHDSIKSALRRARVSRETIRPVSFSTAPAVQTSKTRAEGYLVVPDLQCPFHAPGALEFCEKVRREFGVSKD